MPTYNSGGSHGGFWSGFIGGFGSQIAQQQAQAHADALANKHQTLQTLAHLADRPDLTPEGKRFLFDNMLATLDGGNGKKPGKLSQAAAQMFGGLLGPSEDSMPAPAPTTPVQTPPTGAGGGDLVPGLVGVRQGDLQSFSTPSPPAQSASLPPLPPAVQSRGPFYTPAEAQNLELNAYKAKLGAQTQARVAEAQQMEPIEMDALSKKLKLSNESKVELERSMLPISKEKLRFTEEQRVKRQEAERKAAAENRVVNGGVAPKQGGKPWEFEHVWVKADGTTFRTPAAPPAFVQKTIDMASAEAGRTGKSFEQAYEDINSAHSEMLKQSVKAKTNQANRPVGGAGGTRSATQARMEANVFRRIETQKGQALARVEGDIDKRRAAVSKDLRLTPSQKAAALDLLEGERSKQKALIQKNYENQIAVQKSAEAEAGKPAKAGSPPAAKPTMRFNEQTGMLEPIAR